MWWLERDWGRMNAVRIALVLMCAGLAGGCFQPLYGQRPDGGPSIVGQLNGVEVLPIDAPNGTPESRLGVEVRNALIYNLTGGSGASATSTHKLKINLLASRQQVIVDIQTARPDIENYGIDATYILTDAATGKVVLTGRTFSRVSYDIPGQQQRFARQRGLRDAENRAASVIAENIKSRLASYFVAGS